MAEKICDKTNEGRIDLTLYCDRSPLSVDWGMTVARAYEVFTKLGLRHLVVLGHTGKVEGLITRKDLMVYKMNKFKEVEIYWIRRMQAAIRRQLDAVGFYDGKPAARKVYEKSLREDARDGVTNLWENNKDYSTKETVHVYHAAGSGSLEIPTRLAERSDG